MRNTNLLKVFTLRKKICLSNAYHSLSFRDRFVIKSWYQVLIFQNLGFSSFKLISRKYSTCIVNIAISNISRRTPVLIPECFIYVNTIRSYYNDVIMDSMASQITSLTIVYSAVYSGADQRKHESSSSPAFVRGIHRGPVNSPHKWPVTRKMFPFDDVIMCFWMLLLCYHCVADRSCSTCIIYSLRCIYLDASGRDLRAIYSAMNSCNISSQSHHKVLCCH